MNAAACQLDWITRRDLGIARARQRAERECGDQWTHDAAVYLRDYARHTFGEPFLLEDAREASRPRLTQPQNGKAWGAAVQLACRQGWIQKAGYAPARSSNGSPKCLWKTASADGEATLGH